MSIYVNIIYLFIFGFCYDKNKESLCGRFKYHIFYHIFAVVAKIFFIMFSINVIKYSPL